MKRRKLRDRKGAPLFPGNEVIFYSARKGTKMKAKVVRHFSGEMVEVQIESDPMTVNVSRKQLRKVPLTLESKKRSGGTMATETKNKPSAKELRALAKAEGVDGWESMDRKELVKAIKASRKANKNGGSTTTKRTKTDKKAAIEERAKSRKAPSTKKSSAKKSPAKSKVVSETTSTDSVNPYRKNTNAWHVAELLIKGGIRRTLAKRLVPKLNFTPYKKAGKDIDPEVEAEKRLTLYASQMSQKYGFTIEKDGRGPEGKIRAIPPTS